MGAHGDYGERFVGAHEREANGALLGLLTLLSILTSK